MEYVRWGIDRGLKVDDFANRLSFFFNAHNDLFEEIAKYRAARRIWAREMRDTFGAKNPRSWLLRFHAQTAGVSLTAQQPEVNLVRTTVQALAAVLGGAQSLHTNAYDEAYQVPNEAAARLALRTQQILAHESGVPNTVDPLGGSYSLKAQTARLNKIRRTRDSKKHAAALDRLRKACESDDNTMPFLLDAVRAKATLGEICDVMREVFGAYEEPLLY